MRVKPQPWSQVQGGNNPEVWMKKEKQPATTERELREQRERIRRMYVRGLEETSVEEPETNKNEEAST